MIPNRPPHRTDVLIIGSGFAGSILARVLAARGVNVTIVDPARHPRFAIGESSTPIADALLRRIGREHGLEDLVQLASHGSWRRHHPGLACGKKRGFSYYAHRRGEPLSESHAGQRSLIAAASADDDSSDTHWYRPHLDAYLFDHAIATGAVDRSGHRVVAVAAEGGGAAGRAGYRVELESSLGRETVRCDWVIDASGGAAVLARLFDLPGRRAELSTATQTTYAHYRNVRSFSATHGTEADPFDADDAAQHHLIGTGWLWILRFNNGIASVGYTRPMDAPDDWSGCPDVDRLFDKARIVAPENAPVRRGRLQRLFDPVAGDRAWMMPTAALTLDPLHSVGIAHALVGVRRIAAAILADRTDRIDAAEYRRRLNRETGLLDRLVSTAYAVMEDFPRFSAACQVYFAAAITCEEALDRGDDVDCLWNAGDDAFVDAVEESCRPIANRAANDFLSRTADAIAPWNNAGLFDPDAGGRYAYTATKASG